MTPPFAACHACLCNERTSGNGDSYVCCPDAAWKAIEGRLQLQVHIAPDVIERRHRRHRSGARVFEARPQGIRSGSPALLSDRRTGQRWSPKPCLALQAFGAITLNHSVGGLNPFAVELSGRSGDELSGCTKRGLPLMKLPAAWMGPTPSCRSGPKIQRELARHGNRAAAIDRPRRQRQFDPDEPARRCPGNHRQSQYESWPPAIWDAKRFSPWCAVRCMKMKHEARAGDARRVSFLQSAYRRATSRPGNWRTKKRVPLNIASRHAHRQSAMGWDEVMVSIKESWARALRSFHRSWPDHQSAGVGRFCNVCADPDGRWILGRGHQAHGGDESERAGQLKGFDRLWIPQKVFW